MNVRYIDFAKFKYPAQIEKVMLQFPLIQRIGVPEARDVFIQWLIKTYPDGLSVGQINALLRVTHEYNSINEAWRMNQQYYKDRNDFFDNAVIKRATAYTGWGWVEKAEDTYLVINVKLLKEPVQSRPKDPRRPALSERFRRQNKRII